MATPTETGTAEVGALPNGAAGGEWKQPTEGVNGIPANTVPVVQ